MMRSVSATATSGPVLGVDGCPGGWVGALVTGRRVRWLHAPSVAPLLDAADVVGVDIPIGLPDSGHRLADTAARTRLSNARSSVFFAPTRAVLDARDYADANRISKETAGAGISQQTWHLVPKIRDVDAVITSELQRRVVEVHPELSFRRLDARVIAGKRTARGAGQRLRALHDWVDLEDLGDTPAAAGLDDALDALAAAWSAARWRDGAADVLPSTDPPRDGRNLRMEIVT
jgi:predicted RNase H-like nuclease